MFEQQHDFAVTQMGAPSEEFLSNLFTQEFFQITYQSYRKTKNYTTTYRALKYYYPMLIHISLPVFKSACQDVFPSLKGNPPPTSPLIAYRHNISNKSTSNSLYYTSTPPQEQQRLGKWSPSEETFFIDTLTTLCNQKSKLFNHVNKTIQ